MRLIPGEASRTTHLRHIYTFAGYHGNSLLTLRDTQTWSGCHPFRVAVLLASPQLVAHAFDLGMNSYSESAFRLLSLYFGRRFVLTRGIICA